MIIIEPEQNQDIPKDNEGEEGGEDNKEDQLHDIKS
jgi:hypothetical protein